MGMQTWEKRGMVFTPYADLYEFIPIEDSIQSRRDPRFVPRTVLLDEVEPGQDYEVVITNFHGMAFMRYRVGHYVRFLPDADPAAAKLPQFEFIGRADDRIDLAGFTRIDAKTIWEALAAVGIAHGDWVARKEFSGEAPMLHIYAEMATPPSDLPALELALHEAMRSVDPFYGDLEQMLGIRPLRVTPLTAGAFDRFYDRRQSAGAALGERTPTKMNAPDEDIADLLAVGRLSG